MTQRRGGGAARGPGRVAIGVVGWALLAWLLSACGGSGAADRRPSDAPDHTDGAPDAVAQDSRGDALPDARPDAAADASDSGDASHLGFEPLVLPLVGGWALASSAAIADPPEVIATPGYDTVGWVDAPVPGTVLGALVEAGLAPEPWSGAAFRDLPGIAAPVGADFAMLEIPPESPFAVPWWYRTEFELPAAAAGRPVWLQLEGLNYRAEVWLNGVRLAGEDEVAGTYRSFELPVGHLARPGAANALAVRVRAPRIIDPAHSWVDWNPMPPDKGLGLWRPVRVAVTGPVAVRHPLVRTELPLPALAPARLTLAADLRNGMDAPQEGTLRFRFDGRVVEAPFALAPGETRRVRVTPEDDPALFLPAPRLWWPTPLGAPELYDLEVEALVAGAPSDRRALRFGVRQVTSELTPDGHRRFLVNGQPVLVRGAGWARHLLFAETPAREEREVALVRHLGLNAVRFEGKFATEHLLDLLDESGILVIAGWCCCDWWEATPLWDDATRAVAGASLRDQLRALRHRPSALTWWYGSDRPPTPEVEALYRRVLSEEEWPNPAQSSATEAPTDPGGPTGLKMRGPYEYVPPSYWLTDTARGGAFGFATEVGPGPAPPEVPSLERMLGAEHLWPPDDVWALHAGGNVFRDLSVFDAALAARYGPPTDVADYARKAQLLAYEGHRALFEAYGRNKYGATGVVQWMLNDAWPSLIWHLYDWYLAAGGAFYGARKALRPVHVQWSWDDRSVAVVNATRDDFADLRVTATVWSATGERLADEERSIDLPPDGVVRAFTLPPLADPPPVCFLHLTLADAAGARLDENVYVLPAVDDEIAWEDADWYVTPVRRHADLTALADLPAVPLAGRATQGADGTSLSVTLENPSDRLAFFVRLRIEGPDGAEVLPTFWDDGYVTLPPRTTRTLAARWLPGDAPAGPLTVTVEGWNVPPLRLAPE